VRVVLDTNVWLSGIPRLDEQNSPPRKLIAAWRDGAFDLVISEHILEEITRNLQKPYFKAVLGERDVSPIIDGIGRYADVVDVLEGQEVFGLATHPEDGYVLATATAGRADFLVTGDKQLRNIGSIGATKIVTPSQMLHYLETG